MTFSQWRCLVRTSRPVYKRFCSSSTDKNVKLNNSFVKLKQNKLFEEENARQLSLITRIEKIQVKVEGLDEDMVLIMNKGLSTPFNCAMHISEQLQTLSAIALVNGRPWDMHRPLTDDCVLKFQHFRDEDPRLSNKAYWRSCSFLLGFLAEKAFKDEYYVELHSWPSPNVRSGSFVYDIDLKMGPWTPRKDELRTLSIMGRKIAAQDLKFERLEVDASVALKIFADNQFKHEQIPQIAAGSPSGNDVTLYRLGDHVDISRGPMIANSNLVGTFDVTAIYPLNTDYGLLHRFQGVSLPQQIRMVNFTYLILVERATKVNPGRVPRKPSSDAVYETPLHQTTPEITQ